MSAREGIDHHQRIWITLKMKNPFTSWLLFVGQIKAGDCLRFNTEVASYPAMHELDVAPRASMEVVLLIVVLVYRSC
jgi:hypothetical protein